MYVRIGDVDRGRCDSRNLSEVVVEVDSSKGLHMIGITEGKLNSCHAPNQFNSCTEQIVNIANVLSNETSLRERAGKSSLSCGQGYNPCDCKTACRNNSSSCSKL